MRAAPVCVSAFVCIAAAAVVAQVPNPSGTSSSASVADVHVVTGELADKLDSKTARVGDQVVVKTKSAIHTADEVEIPKGSKLIGHVTGVKALGAEANSQIALAFDRIELKDGRSLSIHGDIQSLAPADDGGTRDTMGAAPSDMPAGHAPGDMYGSTPVATPPAQVPRATQTGSSSSVVDPGAGSNAGAIVAHSGDLVLRTTAVPGLLLANHESSSPGTASSSILLGAKRDIHLESGTRMVISIAPVAAAKSSGTN